MQNRYHQEGGKQKAKQYNKDDKEVLQKITPD